MSNAGFDIKVNVDLPERLLREPGVVLSNQAVLKVIGQRYLQWIDDNFRDRGTERKWAPLRPLTLQMRRHGGDAPLQDSGQLKQSFVPSFTGDSVKVGTEKVYASFHQEGTGPYVITPKTAKVLAGRIGGGGWIIFGKKVNHPGLPARPLIPSKDLAEKLAVETVEAMIDLEASR